MIATLQSLRFFFILLIFMSHFAYGGIPALDAGGDCGVAFFFVLSGFVTSFGYADRLRSGAFSYGRFLKRRLSKLYPLHLLCLAVWLVMAGLPLGLPVLLNALLLQSWVPLADYYFSCNAVSWFLSDLLLCYLLFPWLFRHLSRRWLVVVAVAYALLAIFLPESQVNAVLYVNPLVRLVDFVWGMALFRLYESQPSFRFSSATEWLMVVLVLAALAAYPWLPAKLRTASFYWLVILPAIWVFARGGGVVSRFLCSRWLQWLAALAMPVFLIHKMVIDVLVPRLFPLPYVPALVLTLAATLLVAWLVEHYLLSRCNITRQ